MKRIVVGITGGIASGKSEVRKALEELGFLGIDADLVGHQLLDPGTPTSKRILSHFGKAIQDTATVNSDPRIDRKKLADIVFRKPSELAWLERQLHPAITKQIVKMIIASQKPVALEAIKLIQSDLASICDQRWLVIADDETRIRRLIEKRHLSRAEAESRIASQRNLIWDKNEFDQVFNGSRPLSDLHRQVKSAWAGLKDL